MVSLHHLQGSILRLLNRFRKGTDPGINLALAPPLDVFVVACVQLEQANLFELVSEANFD